MSSEGVLVFLSVQKKNKVVEERRKHEVVGQKSEENSKKQENEHIFSPQAPLTVTMSTGHHTTVMITHNQTQRNVCWDSTEHTEEERGKEESEREEQGGSERKGKEGGQKGESGEERQREEEERQRGEREKRRGNKGGAKPIAPTSSLHYSIRPANRDAECYNPPELDKLVSVRTCACTREDYEWYA